MLEREEYVEQEYFFRILGERLRENLPMQDLFLQLRQEVLATTKLPMAISFLLSEMKHAGVFAPAMARIKHYFTPFQAYIVREAEEERGRFDMRVAMAVLREEAGYRAREVTRQGIFLYQFEVLCRNRLRYDRGLAAIAEDPIYNEDWKEWILTVRRQVGVIDFADMLYVRSELYLQDAARRGKAIDQPEKPVLFGAREGRIAWANRRKDPLYLFAALQRQLGYPQAPRPPKHDPTPELVPQLARRIERLETRIKLLEDEQKGGFDLTQFYEKHRPPTAEE
ncbi:MAG: hypothetical protein KY475_08470 [Planctomycetes bacterium]|nr:hypothetical protein [Planctomycetota bacterium]